MKIFEITLGFGLRKKWIKENLIFYFWVRKDKCCLLHICSKTKSEMQDLVFCGIVELGFSTVF